MIIRLLRRILGILLILSGFVLAMAAVACWFDEMSGTRIGFCTTFGILSLIALVYGIKVGHWKLRDRTSPREVFPQQYVNITRNGNVVVNAQNAAEAVTAIKELRILKTELSLRKRNIHLHQQAIRASYTDTVRRRGSTFRGRGGIAQFIRALQTGSRNGARYNLAKSLRPYENEKQSLEVLLIAVNRRMAELDIYIRQKG